jgi:hypothetical protein
LAVRPRADGAGTVQRAQQASSDLTSKQAPFDAATAAKIVAEPQIDVLNAQKVVLRRNSIKRRRRRIARMPICNCATVIHPVGAKPPRAQVDTMPVGRFFTYAADLLTKQFRSLKPP